MKSLDRGRLTAWITLVSVLALLGYASRATGGKPPKNAAFHYSTAVSGFSVRPARAPFERIRASVPLTSFAASTWNTT